MEATFNQLVESMVQPQKGRPKFPRVLWAALWAMALFTFTEMGVAMLSSVLSEKDIEHQREYYFQVTYHGRSLSHKHYMDFLCKGNIAVECKAIACLGVEQRQQLWNYMRLTNTPIGILYNFAPVKDQCEKYYYNHNTRTIMAF